MSHEDDFGAEDYLALMKAQFGNAAEKFWFYESDLCACCMIRPIDDMVYQGKRSVSLNGYMYRAKGVLIGYFLCGSCATSVMTIAQSGAKTSKKHQAIEANLISAYEHYISSLDD